MTRKAAISIELGTWFLKEAADLPNQAGDFSVQIKESV